MLFLNNTIDACWGYALRSALKFNICIYSIYIKNKTISTKHLFAITRDKNQINVS